MLGHGRNEIAQALGNAIANSVTSSLQESTEIAYLLESVEDKKSFCLLVTGLIVLAIAVDPHALHLLTSFLLGLKARVLPSLIGSLLTKLGQRINSQISVPSAIDS
jgi:hypothetical protein